ncbi:methyltransferase [Actinocrispum wychmicini]|uniref:O-methyltransferase n=1 Tax=Actinocrispum wychmicini TaxID=1213861 RepID=A0A4V2S846_9PSEU|nr:methyltransferase [Actinocrispum wychmicini]TCO62480.1 O-methyltransferase [Actinocrispum wychmicini]
MSTPFTTLSNAAGTVAAFSTAVRLGLLDRIDREPAAPAELARTCGATERGVRVVLAALESTGFVERLPDGRYRPVLTGLAALHPMLPTWEHLPEAVRTGELVYDVAVNDTHPSAAHHAAAVLPEAKRVLDVGAGAAPWTIAYSAKNPGCRVTALDQPAVLPATRRAVARAGLADRYEFVSGDMFETSIELCSYDLIVLAQVCHLFDADACRDLISRLTPALAENGVLAIVEPVTSAMYELSLYLRTRHGRVHSVETYHGWLTDVGLADIQGTDLPSTPAVTVITGRKATDTLGGR